jgi:integrase
MEGHIIGRGKNSWAIVLDIGRDPSTGRRRQKWHTVKGTKKDAQRERTRLLGEINAGSYVEPSKMTVREFLKRWLADYAKAHVSAKTFERYSEIVNCHLSPALGAHELSALRPLHIQGCYSKALESGRRRHSVALGAGLSARTVLHHHRILHEALHQAVRWQLLARNPADSVEPPRPVRQEMRALDEAQIGALLEAARPHPMLRFAILLAVATGLRRGEILALRWRDLDLEAATLSVRQSLEETKGALAFKEPKTDKARRAVALPKLAIEALRQRRADLARTRLMLGPGYHDNDLVCCRLDGRPLHPRSITDAFIDLIRTSSNLPCVRFHDLRHSHATMLLRKGVHPKVVSERLGHSTVGITLDIYSHVLPGMQEEAARKVDDALRAAIGG